MAESTYPPVTKESVQAAKAFQWKERQALPLAVLKLIEKADKKTDRPLVRVK